MSPLPRRKTCWWKLLAAGALLLTNFVTTILPCRSVRADDAKSPDPLDRQFWADAAVYSVIPEQELATYRSYSGGGVGPNGTLGLGINNAKRQFNVSIAAKLKSRHFLATVEVKPLDEDKQMATKEVDYDLSDLNARLLELARDDDGRVYRLSLVPRVIEHPKPAQFKASDLRLEQWSFQSSSVIVNDQDYVGRLSMSGGPIAWCDIPGLAKVEFSLLHLKDAQSLGSLEKGVINIAHESGTTLRISDVKNGTSDEALPGGPYRVWVRWGKPSESLEEYRETMKKYITTLKERTNSGELTLPAGTIERLEKTSQSGRIELIANGTRGVEDDELAEPAAK